MKILHSLTCFVYSGGGISYWGARVRKPWTWSKTLTEFQYGPGHSNPQITTRAPSVRFGLDLHRTKSISRAARVRFGLDLPRSKSRFDED